MERSEAIRALVRYALDKGLIQPSEEMWAVNALLEAKGLEPGAASVDWQAYAQQQGAELRLTREGMYPEFTLDGIPYKAYRVSGKYRDQINCDAVCPEQLDPGLPPRRQGLLQLVRVVLPAVCTFAVILGAGAVVTGGTDWLWLAALAGAGVLLGRCLEKWM